MKELVKIVEKEGKQVVDARNLHRELRVGKDFSTWFKEKVAKYEFEEGVDFVSESYSPDLGSKIPKHGGHLRIDYYLTLNTAKELAMVQENPQGRLIRKYFIEVEKSVSAVLPTARLVYQNIAYTPYITWLIVNGYSVLNARKRMYKHKTQFVKVNEHWYISCELAGALVANKESVKVLNGMQTRMLF
jgi:phage anti-repressor protein